MNNPQSPPPAGLPLPAPLRAADDWLTRRGFTPMPKKVLYRTLLTGVAAAAGSIGPWEHAEELRWFGVFALFSSWIFFSLVSFVSRMISAGWGKGSGVRTFLSFQFRLFLTAIMVYAALVWWSVPVFSLLTGLSVPLVWALAGALATRNN